MKTKILILTMIIGFCVACSKKEAQTPVEEKSSEKQMTSFVFRASDNATLNADVVATINESAKTVAAVLPLGTDLTALTPVIEVSEKASLDSTGEQDFTSEVTYIVTAEDESSVDYRATIEVEVEADPTNNAPDAFDLLEVVDKADGIDILPTFTWETAMDPDGDVVTYDLYLNLSGESELIVAEDLSDTSFTMMDTQKLSLIREYSWKVVAKDGKGGETTSAEFTFTTRPLNDAQKMQLGNNGYFPRESFASVVFDDKMWILGGNAQGMFLNDAWSSPDGLVWTLVNAQSTNTYIERFFHDAEVFEEQLLITGGNTEFGFSSNVSFSSDGIDWFVQDQSLTDTPFIPRAEHTVTSHEGKLWVIGGGGNDANGDAVKLADVWSSENPTIDWQLAVEEADFSVRNLHQTVSFQNKLWVIGGIGDENIGFLNDVWSSTDGIVWEEVIPISPFSPRGFHTSLVFDNKLWVIGGSGDSGNTNDIWYSEDGEEWIDATPENSFPTTSNFKAHYFNDKIWLLFESGEVWTLD